MSLEVRSFNCPNCAAPLDIRNLGRSQTLTCPYCHAVIDLTRPPYQAIGNAGNRPPPVGTPFNLGMQGPLGENVYQIIGRVRYQDDEDLWDEWLLLSQAGAYRWLSDSEDVGLVVWEPFTPSAPIDPATLTTGRTIQLDGTRARVRSRGTAVIAYQEGELTWRAVVGDRMSYAEAAAADAMYSIEWTANEIEFYRGFRLDRRAVEASFGVFAGAGAPGGSGSPPVGFGPTPRRRGGCAPNAVILVVLVVIVACVLLAAFAPSSSGGGSSYFPSSSIRSSGGGGRSSGSGSSGGGGK